MDQWLFGSRIGGGARTAWRGARENFLGVMMGCPVNMLVCDGICKGGINVLKSVET